MATMNNQSKDNSNGNIAKNGSQVYVPKQTRKTTAAITEAEPKKRSEANWSPVMDGIVPTPPSFAKNGNLSNATISTSGANWSPVKDDIVPTPPSFAKNGNISNATKSTSGANWSPVMDGIVPTPPSLAKNGNVSNATKSTCGAKVADEKFAEMVNAHIDNVLYGPRKTRRLPIFEEICPE